MLLGWGAAVLGSLLPESWRWSPAAFALAAVLLLGGLALDLGVGGTRLPTWRRQVDEAWIGRYRGWVVGAGFGAQLGLGVVTIVTSATTYAVVLVCLLTGTPAAGALIGGVFGLVRALPLVLMARVDTRERLYGALRAVDRWSRTADLVAKVSLGGAATVLAWFALRGA
jgi:hypothetical protein